MAIKDGTETIQNPDQTEPFTAFSKVVEPGVYHPLPDDWLLGLSDVENSTGAIASGRYKAVNMAGAAAISAAMNAFDHEPFPFIFGGDGAAFAVPPERAGLAGDVLSRTAGWVRTDLDLSLRVALVPVSAIRAAGHDVLVGWYGVSSTVRYAVFSGGGLSWAEDAMKSGSFLLQPAAPHDRPDLTGLSCRWNRIGASKGVILSLILRPAAETGDRRFADLVLAVLNLLSGERDSHPVPVDGPGFSWPPSGLGLEARAARRIGSLFKQQLIVAATALLAWGLDKTGWSLGAFDPRHYRRQTAINTDFRKFDDGLRMTVDCTPEAVSRIEDHLKQAEAQGIAVYGLHTQTEALMTCIVPSVMSDDHMHFLDGADGGYARAAERLKTAARQTDT